MRSLFLNQIIILNNNIEFTCDPLKGFDDPTNNGEYILNFKEFHYKTGNYYEGFAVKEWIYHISDDNAYSIHFGMPVHRNNISINTPLKWKPIDSSEISCLLAYSMSDKYIDNNNLDYFSISRYDSNGLSIEELNSKKYGLKNLQVDYSDRLIITIDSVTFNINRLVVIYEGQKRLLMNMNVLFDNSYYNIICRFSDIDLDTNQLLFFEMLRNIKIEDRFLFPYKGTISMQHIEEGFY